MKTPHFIDWVLDFSHSTAEKSFNSSHINFKL